MSKGRKIQFFKRRLSLKRERLTPTAKCMIVKSPCCCYLKSLALNPYLELRIYQKSGKVRRTLKDLSTGLSLL